MFEIFLTAINAILPIVLLIVLGYFLKRIKFLTGEFLKIGNKLVFNVCLPCMLFMNIYSIEDLGEVNWGLVAYCLIAVFVIFFIGLAVSVLTTKDNKRRGVILQCCYRSNFAIIGTSLAASLAGSAADVMDKVNGVVAIIQLFTIPVFNILAVISLSVFVEKPQAQIGESGLIEPQRKPVDIKKIVLNIVKNPLIIGIFTGLVFLGLRYAESAIFDGRTPFTLKDDLTFLYNTLNNLKQIATPLALIVLGGQFEFSQVKGMSKEIAVATVFRVAIAPFLCIGIAVILSEYTPLFTFGQTEYPAIISLFGTPVAVSSAIMAGEMGNDEQLAGQLVVWTSITSIITLFASVMILMSFGLLAL